MDQQVVAAPLGQQVLQLLPGPVGDELGPIAGRMGLQMGEVGRDDDVARVDRELARRQRGYGRGGRMKIEKDAARRSRWVTRPTSLPS